jgi:uncharacterized protein (TIGR00255 family)
MTAYAYKEFSNNEITLSIEIRSYNSRFLDMSINLPPWLYSLETRIRELVALRFIRGKVEVLIRVKEQNTGITAKINGNLASVYNTALRGLAKQLSLNEEPSLELLAAFEGVLDIETERDNEKYWAILEPILIAAIDEADAGRLREGEFTKKDIISGLNVLDESLKIIGAFLPELENNIKENLKTRFAELLGDRIDEGRILAETAVLLMKYSISEEVSRFSSHLAGFRLEVERDSASGKKLDFFCQEINREINTIGSNTPILEVSRAVVEMKNALEGIREQLRNVL